MIGLIKYFLRFGLLLGSLAAVMPFAHNPRNDLAGPVLQGLITYTVVFLNPMSPIMVIGWCIPMYHLIRYITRYGKKDRTKWDIIDTACWLTILPAIAARLFFEFPSRYSLSDYLPWATLYFVAPVVFYGTLFGLFAQVYSFYRKRMGYVT